MLIGLTGVKKDSATNRARAFNCNRSVLEEAERLGGETHEKLHFRNLLVHFLHELYNKIDELVFEHRLGVEVGN